MTRAVPDSGWIGSWSPGIGDPTIAGWVTAFAYLGAAYLCLRVQRRMRAAAGPAPARVLASFAYALTGRLRRLWALPMDARLVALWTGLATVMFLLGINKQLDLQSALTEAGRLMARSEGWYEVRRQVQAAFIGVVLVVGAWSFVSVLALARGDLRRVWPVLAGTVFLLCFVAIRATSFHHVDWLIHFKLSGIKVNWILELGGIVLVSYGAWRAGAVGFAAGRKRR